VESDDRPVAHPRHDPSPGLDAFRRGRSARRCAPSPPTPFPLFRSGERTVHPDGHIEVDGSDYPVPARLLGDLVRVQWDDHLVRVYHATRW